MEAVLEPNTKYLVSEETPEKVTPPCAQLHTDQFVMVNIALVTV